MRPWQGLWIGGLALAAACEGPAPSAPPAQAPTVAPPTAPAPAPGAAQALAASFSPDIVGTLVPGLPRAGDYAMQLGLTFDAFPTMEMHINDRRHGVVRLTLAADGTARGCIGAHSDDVVQGQWHYEPDPARRQHHAETQDQLLALRGTWRVDDGVAAVRFDHLAWSTCDGSAPEWPPDPPTELRCVAIASSDRLPTGGLACTANPQGQLLGLGMPMTRASQRDGLGPAMSTPRGTELLLGAPGLVVDVSQAANAKQPTFQVRAAAVTLDEAAYRPAPTKKETAARP
jgi:hypothetical protein